MIDDAIREFKAALIAALPPDGDHSAESACQALDEIIAAIRAECFANSPLTAWLMQEPGTRFTMAEYDEDSKRIRCNLDDVNDDGDDPVAFGYGESIEEAQAAAMNMLAGRVQ